MTSQQAAALLVIAALGGCSSGASSAARPSTSPAASAPAADKGKVTVRLGVVYAGGPAGGTRVLRAATVTLVGTTGILPRVVGVEEGKRTPVQLAPGFYLVSASSGEADCVTTQATIKPGPPFDVTVTCSVK